MVDQKILIPSLRERFAPILRSLGFKGSGKRYRRLGADCIHVVEVQLRSGGESFAINLGLQPLDIPDVLGNEPAEKEITGGLCEFRRRLSERDHDQWGSFQSSDDASRAVEQCSKIFLEFGEKSFIEQTGPSSALRTVSPADFESGNFDFSGFSSTKVRMARALSLMRRAVGDHKKSRDFAVIALKHMGSASGLKRELEALAHEATRMH
ncbi:DUF4304 domain-containing protein [Inquilinus limosus]|uniref:DUF4304 domain-containing protein n=1 Tax=Inquilinus limosus TaxID=171674 RepID=UPI003F14B908